MVSQSAPPATRARDAAAAPASRDVLHSASFSLAAFALTCRGADTCGLSGGRSTRGACGGAGGPAEGAGQARGARARDEGSSRQVHHRDIRSRAGAGGGRVSGAPSRQRAFVASFWGADCTAQTHPSTPHAGTAQAEQRKYKEELLAGIREKMNQLLNSGGASRLRRRASNDASRGR